MARRRAMLGHRMKLVKLTSLFSSCLTRRAFNMIPNKIIHPQIPTTYPAWNIELNSRGKNFYRNMKFKTSYRNIKVELFKSVLGKMTQQQELPVTKVTDLLYLFSSKYVNNLFVYWIKLSLWCLTWLVQDICIFFWWAVSFSILGYVINKRKDSSMLLPK